MKRVTKKAVATVLTSAMIFTTLLPGNVKPLLAFGGTSEEFSVEQLTDFEYDDASLTSDGYFFMKGGTFEYEGGKDSNMDENAVLVTVDSNGNKTEIPSNTAEGRKFTKIVKASTDGYYNMVKLVNGDKSALVHTNGKYFGGIEQYYDFVEPKTDNIAIIGNDTGEKSGENSIYDSKIITETGKELSIGKVTEKDLYFGMVRKVGNREIIGINNDNYYIYDTETDILEKVDAKEVYTIDNNKYYYVTDYRYTDIYDGMGNIVFEIPWSCSDISKYEMDTDGYAILQGRDQKRNIIGKDGELWHADDWDKNVSTVELSVIDAQKKIYKADIKYKGELSYKYYIYSKDEGLLIDIPNEIEKIGAQRGYEKAVGGCYIFGNNIILNVFDDNNSSSGVIFVYQESNHYQNPQEIKGNRVSQCKDREYLLTENRNGTDSNTLSALYNVQLEQIPLAENINFRYTVSLWNKAYVCSVEGIDGKIRLLGVNGKLEGDVTYMGNRVKYLSLVSEDEKGDYKTDLYNDDGVKIISGFLSHKLPDVLDPYVNQNYICLYETGDSYVLCDLKGKVLMTDQQYSLKSFIEAADESVLATVYQKDESGNYKYAAVKISSTKTDLNKNGVYVENGEVRYYENGKVNKAYTGMAADSTTGKRYWFDNGVVARDKQVYSPADDAWYWFDADGTMAVGKDVFVPKSNDDRSEGKWVRYDENGHMVKGEDYANGGWYRFDETTGEMAKGFYTVQDGDNTKLYYYNEDTGIMEHGAVNIDGTEYAFDDVTGVAVNNSWYSIDNAPYWYENGVRQGMEGRGKEIYDPASDGWYWLDAVDGGKKAVSKDVYQESYAGAYADREDGTGKWVRYDENGRMIKGWSQQNGNTYYFDLETGAMAKGSAVIDGAEHYFNTATDVQER